MAAAMALDDGLAAAAFPSSPCAAAAARPMQDGPAWSTMSATQSAVSCSPTIGPDGDWQDCKAQAPPTWRHRKHDNEHTGKHSDGKL